MMNPLVSVTWIVPVLPPDDEFRWQHLPVAWNSIDAEILTSDHPDPDSLSTWMLEAQPMGYGGCLHCETTAQESRS